MSEPGREVGDGAAAIGEISVVSRVRSRIVVHDRQEISTLLFGRSSQTPGRR